jgi:deoxyribonuclease-4
MIGAHFSKSSALLDAKVTSAELVQVFISNPRGYAPPTAADVLIFDNFPVDVYVHLPYLVNFPSEREDVRKNSLTLLKATDAQLNNNFKGVVVHGGQGGKLIDTPAAIDRWLELLNGTNLSTPLLVENTAGGNSAPGKDLKDLVLLVSQLKANGLTNIGVCLDTCHAWAAGYENLLDAYSYLKNELGKVDLLHVNGSRDTLSSNRDRHALLSEGFIPFDNIAKLAIQAKLDGTPMVLETPGDNLLWAAEIKLIKNL